MIFITKFSKTKHKLYIASG